MSRTKRILRRAAIAIGGGLGVLILGLAGLYAWAQSDAGRSWIARSLEDALGRPGELTLQIGALEGRLPDAPRITGLRVDDLQGTWLTAERIAIDWRPLALISGRLEVADLAITDLHVSRRPETPAGADGENDGGLLPDLPFQVLLERLAIEEVALGPAVLGAPAAFRVHGEAATQGADSLRAALTLERSDGVEGRATAEASFRPGDRHLTLDLEVSEPAGGLIARALEISELPALAVKLHGEGPLDDWSCRLDGSLQGLATVEADLTLAGREPLAFQVAGQARSEASGEDLPWRLLAGQLSFRAEGAWQAPGSLRLDLARLDGPAATLALDGTLDTRAGQIDARARAELKDPSLLRELIGEGEAEGLAIGLAAQGALRQPELRLDLAARTLSLTELQASGITAEASFQPAGPLDAGTIKGALAASGSFDSLKVAELRDLEPLLGERLSWRLEGGLDLAAARFEARDLLLKAEAVTLTGSGGVSFESGDAETELAIEAADLSGLSPLVGLEVGGRGRLAGPVTFGNFGETLRASLSGALDGVSLDEPLLQALFGGRSDVAARLALAPDGSFRVSDIDVRSATARLSGEAGFPSDFDSLTSAYHLEVDDIAVLAPALGAELSGAALLEGKAEGPVDDPRLSGRLAMPDARVEGIALRGLQVDYSAADLAGEPHGRLAAAAKTDYGAVEAAADYRLGADRLTLTDLTARSQGATLAGQVTLPLDGGPLAGELTGQTGNLKPWLALAGLDGSGGAQARLSLAAKGERQAADLAASGKDLTLELGDGQQFAVGNADLALALDDLAAGRGGKLAVSATGLSLDDLALDTLKFDAEGALDDAAVELSAAGRWIEELDLQAAGRVTRRGDSIALALARLEGHTMGQALRLRGPARLARQGKVLSIENTALDFGGAGLTVGAELGGEQLVLDLQAADLPLALLAPLLDSPGLTGQANGRVQVSGPAADPAGNLELRVTDLKLVSAKTVPPLQLALTGVWRKGRLNLDATLENLAEQPARLGAELPLRLDPASLAPILPEDEAISGHLSWQGRIAEIWPLVPVTGHGLDGAGEIDLLVSGSLAQPRSSGRFSLSQGQYESFEAGTLLRDLEIVADLEGERVVLSKLSATDGDKGRLTAEGQLDLLPERAFPFAMEARFKSFRMLRRDDVSATAGGTLNFSGSLEQAKLTGRFKTDQAELRIPDQLPPNVVDLGVVVMDEKGVATPSGQDRAAAKSDLDLVLDLLFDMPRRVFVRGRGLDSEWTGKLEVGGTPAAPVLNGKLELVRGQLSILGKSFKLSEGSVTFDGEAEIDPLIDIAAVNQSSELTVTARIKGRASNPVLEISSVPELPQDEIVSRVLFRKNTSQLSAVEAVQLAAAVAKLSGSGVGAGGVLDLARDTLGIDVLRIETTGSGESETPALSAGKYVTDDIFLGVKQGVARDSGSVGVEVEVTPNISIESGVGRTGDTNAGIKFKWDY